MRKTDWEKLAKQQRQRQRKKWATRNVHRKIVGKPDYQAPEYKLLREQRRNRGV